MATGVACSPTLMSALPERTITTVASPASVTFTRYSPLRLMLNASCGVSISKPSPGAIV
jgi:hypothetical protein